MLRKQGGSAIAELGPALFLLLIVGVFPVVDAMFAGYTYFASVLLNNLELREASRIPASDTEDAMTRIAYNWQNSGLGRLASVIGQPQTQCAYNVVNIEGAVHPGTETYVTVSTTVTVKPCCPIPFFGKIPCLGAPVTYSIVGKKIMENQSLASM